MAKTKTLESLNSRTFSKDETVWSFLLPVSFFFVQYGYGFGTPMLTYCTLFAIYYVIKNSEFPVFRPLSVYTIWYVAVLLSTVIVYNHVLDRPYFMHLIQILASGYCMGIIAKHLDKEALYRCWKVLGLIVCVVVFYQFIQIFFLHRTVLPIRLLSVSSESLMRNGNWTVHSYRPVAFFTEPSMIVSFLVPVMLLAQQKKEWLVLVIISIAILLSGSTSGVVALVVMWGVYIINNRSGFVNKFILAVLFIGAAYAFLNLSFFSGSVEKINYELSGNSSNMNVRMLRGWWIFDCLDIRSKLFGISDYDISSYVYENEKTWVFTHQTVHEDNFYLNTAQRILIQTGLVGAALYVWMLIKLWKSTNSVVKTYLLFVIVSMFFGSEFYISGLFVMQFIVLLAFLKDPELLSGKK